MKKVIIDPPLQGLRIVEVSAFVAAPSGAMTLAQLGAEVIRIDPLGGNIDYTRWPITSDGASIYWAGLNGTDVLWGPYRSFKQLTEEDKRCSLENPLFAEVNHPEIGTILTPKSPLSFSQAKELPPLPAPRLGQDTGWALQKILGLSPGEIQRLQEKGIIAAVKRVSL
jgi:crotonobetainyl-CoA:carnitine CoA-transferase CaiB-like acyl-CoA transferase